ncbi:MAG: hypothetical protein ACSHWN_12350 [Methylophilaceae bacterium]
MKKLQDFGQDTIAVELTQPQLKLSIAVNTFLIELLTQDRKSSMQANKDIVKAMTDVVNLRHSFTFSDYQQNIDGLINDLHALADPLVNAFVDRQDEHQQIFLQEVNDLSKKLHPDTFFLRECKTLGLADDSGSLHLRNDHD